MPTNNSGPFSVREYSRISSKINPFALQISFAEGKANDNNGYIGGYVTIEEFNDYVADTSSKLWSCKIVKSLPSNPESNVLYLIDQGDGKYEEYIYIDGQPDVIGDSSADAPHWNGL